MAEIETIKQETYNPAAQNGGVREVSCYTLRLR